MQKNHIYSIIVAWFLIAFEVLYDLKFAGYILLAVATFMLLAAFYSLYIEDVDQVEEGE